MYVQPSDTAVGGCRSQSPWSRMAQMSFKRSHSYLSKFKSQWQATFAALLVTCSPQSFSFLGKRKRYQSMHVDNLQHPSTAGPCRKFTQTDCHHSPSLLKQHQEPRQRAYQAPVSAWFDCWDTTACFWCFLLKHFKNNFLALRQFNSSLSFCIRLLNKNTFTCKPQCYY